MSWCVPRSLGLPDSSILKPYLGRGFRLWLIVRIAIAAVPLLAGGGTVSDALSWDPVSAIATLSVCALLGFIDTRRRGERALLGNLGIQDRALVAMFLAAPAAGEILLALALPR
jgi:hypothetical protein